MEERRASRRAWSRRPFSGQRGVMVAAAIVWFQAWSSPVRGDDAKTDEKAAQELFDQGLRLFDRGRFAEACVQFENSLALYDGVGIRGKLAECYERLGRLASAWRLYREVARLAGDRDQQARAEVAAKRAKELRPRLPRLKIEPGPSVAITGFQILHNSVDVHSTQFSRRRYVDPGTHIVVASAPGRRPWKKTLILTEGQSQTVTAPELEPSEEGRDEGGAAGEGESDRGGGGGKTAGWVLFGAGIASIGVMTYFGGTAYLNEKECHENPVCSDDQYERRVDRNARFADYAAAAGLVLGAVGLLLVWSSGDASGDGAQTSLQVIPTITPDAVGIIVRRPL